MPGLQYDNLVHVHTGHTNVGYDLLVNTIDLFTVVCFVAWPLNENEAGGDLVLIKTSLLLLN